jgi:hypothetical protein
MTPVTIILLAVTIYDGILMATKELTVKSTYTISKSIAIFGILSLLVVSSLCATIYCWWRSCACRQSRSSVFSDDEDDYRMSVGGFPLPPSMQDENYLEKQEAHARRKQFKVLRLNPCCCFRIE